MQPDEIYHEELSSFWGKLAIAMMFGSSLTFVILFFYQRTYGPVGDDPAPDWVYLVMFAWFLAIGFLVLNFAILTVSATPRGITVAYGRFRYHIPWENIGSYQLDRRPAMLNYGGYGIRISSRANGSVLTYNIMGASTVVLELKQKRFKYFAFSTRRPDELLALIQNWKR